MAARFRLAIIGAGPAGLSAAARAAEIGVAHVLLEATDDVAATVTRYQKGKWVMSEPAKLPLRSTISFAAGTRESVLESWRSDSHRLGVRLRTGTRVVGISGRSGEFTLTLESGETLAAEAVVIALGVQGNIRKLNVPGENIPRVQYQLDDPDEYAGETIVVVGGGDSGVENALALARRNRVVLVNRHEEFTACGEANLALLEAAIAAGQIETRLGSSPGRVDATADGVSPLLLTLQTPQGAEDIACDRIIARLGAVLPRAVLERFGIRFASEDPAAVPALSEHYESNVAGLYVIGSLAGYPLIKQALNQGYEVVEHIVGNPVQPADEALLWEKLARVRGVVSVSDGMALIQRGQPLFASLTPLQLREFLLDSNVLTPQADEILFHRDDYGNSFFSVLRGSVRIHVEGRDGSMTTFSATAGEFFGEIGLLSGRRRTGTVVAERDCVLLETPRRSMLRLLHVSPAAQQRIDEVSLKRIVGNCFGAALDAHQLEHLVQGATTRRYQAGEILFREGDAADALYVLRRGAVTVSRSVGGREVVLTYLSAGNYVGEIALVSDAPRTATIRAAAATEAVLLEAARFSAVLGDNASVRSEVVGRYLERVGANESGTTGKNRDVVRFLVDQGVGEATDVLLIDYARCIRCDNCERACADVHDGTSRLSRRSGRTYENVHVPASCRHCEHPNCMKDCPADAIRRSLDGEIFIDANCIGCGNCRSHCPYGVIQLAGRAEASRRTWLDLIFRRHPSAAEEPQPAKRAVKCDMCRGIIGGAACVRACPTGAAYRVSHEQLLAHIR